MAHCRRAVLRVLFKICGGNVPSSACTKISRSTFYCFDASQLDRGVLHKNFVQILDFNNKK